MSYKRSNKALGVFMVLGAIAFPVLKSIYIPYGANRHPAVPESAKEVLPQQGIIAPVSRVVDGDTIKVVIDGYEDTVRLIGINSPESVDSRQAVECFGKEASDHLKKILSGEDVGLIPDASQGSRDKYGRLLAYVYMTDNTFVNKEMVKDGYAFEYTYDLPYKYQNDFKKAEANARSQKLGLWDPNVCKYTEDPKYSRGGLRK